MIRPMPLSPEQCPDWDAIDTVCLDLDGTLLDQAYDNHIWRDLVPEHFAIRHGLPLETARERVVRHYEDHHGTLQAYSLEYWADLCGVDLFELHRQEQARIDWLDGAADFLAQLRAMPKRLVLLTNSHPFALELKHAKTRVLDYFHEAASSQEFGAPKEDQQFWVRAREKFGFDPERSLFADDNLRMLRAAEKAGMRWIYGVRISDTRWPPLSHDHYPAVDRVRELLD
jgi:HAD superfamily hydrolase (TIGR01509 family)